MEEVDAINKMAMEQISRMDGAKKVEVPPVVSQQKQSFWSNDTVSRYRPSESSGNGSPPFTGYAPRTYYSSLSGYGSSQSSGSTMDAHYRKILNAVYKQERQEGAQQIQLGGYTMPGPVDNLSLFGGGNTQYSPPIQGTQQTAAPGAPGAQAAPRLTFSQDARNQVTAIVMSGVTKMITTMVLNWARDKRVPYELL